MTILEILHTNYSLCLDDDRDRKRLAVALSKHYKNPHGKILDLLDKYCTSYCLDDDTDIANVNRALETRLVRKT